MFIFYLYIVYISVSDTHRKTINAITLYDYYFIDYKCYSMFLWKLMYKII